MDVVDEMIQLPLALVTMPGTPNRKVKCTFHHPSPFEFFSNKGVHWHEARPVQRNYYGKKQTSKDKPTSASNTWKSVVGMEGLSSLLESEEDGHTGDRDGEGEEEEEQNTEKQQDQMTPLVQHRNKERPSLGSLSTTSENSTHSDVAEGLQFTEESHHREDEGRQHKTEETETKLHGHSDKTKVLGVNAPANQLGSKNGLAKQAFSKKFSSAQQKRGSVAKMSRMSMKSARAPSMNQMRRISVGGSAYALPGLANKSVKPPGQNSTSETSEQTKASSSLKDRMSLIGAVKLPGLDVKQTPGNVLTKKPQASTTKTSSLNQETEAQRRDTKRKELSKEESLKVFEFVLEFLDSYHLMHIAPQVCKDWNRISRTLYSWRAAETKHHDFADTSSKPVVPLNTQWYPFLKAFPWGRYLTAGGFKEVYEVWCAALCRMEAVAIMDVETLCAVDNFEMVKAEVQTSCLLSELVRTGKCPHYVEVYQVFPHQYHISAAWWGNEESTNPWQVSAGELSSVYSQHSEKVKSAIESIQGDDSQSSDNPQVAKIPSPPESEKSHYQYIRMELCAQGDMEEFLRMEDGENIDVSYSGQDALSYVFQMAFSLHVAQREIGLCHYDIKLLNFLLRPASEMLNSNDCNNSCVHLRYKIEDANYRLLLPLDCYSKRSNLVKLADFGTADCDSESLGKSVQVHHFTTFENVPPEFLIYGDASTQGFHNDMWNLGLCMFHCFTGAMPYEEILEEVQAPDALIKELEGLWKDKAKLGQRRLSQARKQKSSSNDRTSLYPEEINATFEDVTFLALGEALKSDEEHTLAHTLWRFVVLLGFPGSEEAVHKENPPEFENNPVWRLLRKYILPEESALAKPTRGKKKSNSAVQRCAETYQRDIERFSIVKGSHPLVKKLRSRLEEIPEGENLLYGLLTFSACNRLAGRDVVLHPAFDLYRDEPAEDAVGSGDCSVQIISS
eukprot:gb/GECG01003941.1/.p1 GENE.gb/GECG01003941.1/~~gb/GECG01003941.1/.p1  ORF type:complete len:957 (+),score=127.79 gb/GECG01003941.1/:1-2871(+)